MSSLIREGIRRTLPDNPWRPIQERPEAVVLSQSEDMRHCRRCDILAGKIRNISRDSCIFIPPPFITATSTSRSILSNR